MSGILDNSLVILALLASCGYALASLSPQSLRRRAFAALAGAVARVPRFLRLRRVAERLAAAASEKAQGACGGCDSCGSDRAPAAVRIPADKIGRRV